MKKRYSISVTDFSLPSPRVGSIDIYSGFQGQTAGQQLHKDIQFERQKKDSTYEAEVWSTYSFNLDKYIFDVSGRIDGQFRTDKTVIEEIKTAFDINRLQHYLKDTEETHPYWLQLKTYGYLHWLKKQEIPELQLILVSQRNKKIIELTTPFEIKPYEKWLASRLKDLTSQIKENEKRIKKRRKTAKTLVFPFENPRKGQYELIETVKDGMKSKSTLLLQAPTGLGKTIGILHPALEESLSRGQKVIYITPKNSQHTVALDAIKKMQQRKANINSLTLTAKNKMCFKAQQLCNREYCEYAEDHYTKIENHALLKRAQKEKNLTNAFFIETGKEYQVCPYELQMECIPYVDTIICDYNYVFGMSSSNNRVGKLQMGETEKPNLVIDEIHNLPARGMDYYSPTLSITVLETIWFQLEKVHEVFRETFRLILNECMEIIKNCKSIELAEPHLIQPPQTIFKEQNTKIKDFLAKYLAADIQITENDLVLMLANYWMDFTSALDYVNDDYPEFFTSYYPNPESVKITCCDASKLLANSYSNYEQVIGFSATLKPFKYYGQLTGLKNSSITAEFESPFPKENKKIIIIPQLSSKYADRQYQYARIMDAILKITALKKGNYFVFFPSFDFLEKVYRLFKPTESDYKILRQHQQMKEYDVKKIFSHLQHDTDHYLMFAVQGGIFSEGVDYPGKMTIGAFVVGPPLPMFDWEREQMKQYYEKNYSAGFDYAYTFPAMAKAVQAAGRVIRSDTDKGIIVLIDNRFLLENYAKCMPTDWYNEQPIELISHSILKDIQTFWDSNS